jgi:hypothetical protein
MPIIIILILVAAILSGSLGGVLEVAAGVVLGLVLFVVGVAVAVWWYLRRKVRSFGRELDQFRGTRYPRDRYPDDRSA